MCHFLFDGLRQSHLKTSHSTPRRRILIFQLLPGRLHFSLLHLMKTQYTMYTTLQRLACSLNPLVFISSEYITKLLSPAYLLNSISATLLIIALIPVSNSIKSASAGVKTFFTHRSMYRKEGVFCLY